MIAALGEIYGVHLVNLFIATTFMPSEQWYVPTESSFPIPYQYIDVVRDTKTHLDNLEGSTTDGL